MSTIPAQFRDLIDDAAIFPPGEMPLGPALAQHSAYRRSEIASLIGPFIVDAGRLEELAAIVREDETLDQLGISVVLRSAELATVVELLADMPQLELASLEIRVPATGSLAAAVSDLVDAREGLFAEAALPESVDVYVELPRAEGVPEADWADAARAVALTGMRFKFRLGGTTASDYPSATEVATQLHTAVSNHSPFKCTAGLHRAIRHTDPDTGFEHHGFLNVLLATAETAAGADIATVSACLDERDAAVIADRLARADAQALEAARGFFTSYGSCSVTEPLDDLTAMGMIKLEEASR